MNHATQFGQWLRQRRKALDLTQEDLAERLGCSDGTIRKIEAGERRPSRQMAELLADCLRIAPEERQVFILLARGTVADVDQPATAPMTSVDAFAAMTHTAQPPSATTASNLPIQPTAFIGRGKEIEDLCSLVRRPEARLVTLTGPGGVGKTRLGLQVAFEMLGEFEYEVYFVPLAPITDPNLVAATIAHMLGVSETPGRPLLDSLKDRLRRKGILLLLDNYEQVVASASLLADLLASAATLTLLVTSREVMRLRGEYEYAVPPLALPDPSFPSPSAGQLAEYEAIRLFVERAQAAKPGFALTDENAKAISEICQRVDGLPLAIELAAARVKLFPPQAMLGRMENRLKLLTGGARDLPTRQQTLSKTIAWSYDLLEPDERKLFRCLSVFVGGCALHAIEAICSAMGDLEMDPLNGVTSLIDKSLLRQVDGANDSRFLMLETIREYGLERLLESEELEELRRLHATYYLALAELAESELRGAQQGMWFERLQLELGNLRAAMSWMLGRNDAEMAARLGGALWRFMWTYGYLTEERGWLEAALTDSGLSPTVRAKALNAAGILATEQGDTERAEACFTESLELRRDLNDKSGIADSLTALGNLAYYQNDYPSARTFYDEDSTLRRELNDKHGISVVLNNLGSMVHKEGDLTRAAELYEESVSIERELGDKQGIAAALSNLAEVATDRGDHHRASELYKETLALSWELGDKHGLTVSFEGLAGASGVRGGERQAIYAARLFGAAEALREMIGAVMPPSYIPTYEHLAAIARAQVSEAEWQEAWADGRAMTLKQAYLFALGNPDSAL